MNTMIHEYIFEKSIEIILLIILPSLFGGYTSDYIKTLQGKNLNIKIGRILISSVFSSILVYSILYQKLIKSDNHNYLLLISFLLGCIGFEIAQYVITLDGWKKLYKKTKWIFKLIEDFKKFRNNQK